jgi:hypothetical protein
LSTRDVVVLGKYHPQRIVVGIWQAAVDIVRKIALVR